MPRVQTLQLGFFRIIAVITSGALCTVLALLALSVLLLSRHMAERQHAHVSALAHQSDQLLTYTEDLLHSVGMAALNAPPSIQFDLLNQVRMSSSEVHALYLLDSSGIVIADANHEDSFHGFDLSREPSFMQAREDRLPVVSTPFLSPTDGEIAATMAVPLLVGGKVQGVLLGELSLRAIQTAISGVNVNPGEILVVVDEHGSLLAHPQPEWVQQRRNLANLTLVQDGMAGREAMRIVVDAYHGGLVVGSATRTNVGWAVLTEQPLLIAAQPVIWMFAAAVVAIGASFGLALLAVRQGLHRITEPIARLAAAADALASGRPGVVPSNDLSPFTELASLGMSVAHMAAELQANITSLEQRVIEIQRTKAQLQTSLHEKELLLKEIHHRVKNNLQVVISLLRLQSRTVQDKQTLAALHESQQRITTMVLVHELLYQSGDLAHIDAKAYMNHLTDQVRRVYGDSLANITLTVEVVLQRLDLDHAVPCGLIVNELLSNSLKYAFPDGRNGHIGVALTMSSATMYCLQVSDNGIGLPQERELHQHTSLGMRLVQSLTRQLRGSLSIDRTTGTTVTVTFPV